MNKDLRVFMMPFIDELIAARQGVKSYFQKEIKKADSNISYEMFQVLMFLWSKNKVNQQEIANKVQKGKASLTPLIDNLSKLNLVTRTEDPTDRRNKIIALTDEGQNFKKKFEPVIIEFCSVFNAAIPADAIKEMTLVLSKMTGAITN
jgi:DNA-binding MarR family transcriptional regulator